MSVIDEPLSKAVKVRLHHASSHLARLDWYGRFLHREHMA